MKDSFNYSGFSSTLVMMRRRKKKDQNKTVVILSADREAQDLNRFCPPYLLQPSKLKAEIK